MHVLKLIVPEAGRAFESESKAYAVYNTYADKVGFNIRKSTTKRRTLDGTISQKYIVCSCNIPATPGLAIVTSDSYLGS
jgi:hypothetical protein